MPTVVIYQLLAENFALDSTFNEVPEIEFECERIVNCGEEVIMPLIWARGADNENLQCVLSNDSSVVNYSQLANLDNEFLYWMEWGAQVPMVLQILLQNRATVLDVFGSYGRWSLRVLYPDHDEFSRSVQFCQTHDLTINVKRVRSLDCESTNRYGLTDSQYEALWVAWKRGYFDVPRTVDLATVADELGISHQALSERLRRGYSTLIKETLGLVGSEQEAPRQLTFRHVN